MNEIQDLFLAFYYEHAQLATDPKEQERYIQAAEKIRLKQQGKENKPEV